MLLVEVLHDSSLETATDVLGEFAELTVVFALPPLERTEGSHSILDTQEKIVGVSSLIWPIHEAEYFSESLLESAGSIGMGVNA